MYLALVIAICLMNSIQKAASYSSCYEIMNTQNDPQRTYTMPGLRIMPFSTTVTCKNVSSFTSLYIRNRYAHTKNDYPQYLSVTESKVAEIPKNAFANFSYILKLYLSGIHLKTIQSGAFDNLTNLEELYLDNNNLTEVADVFSSLNSLRTLSLKNNKISKIATSAFEKLQYLKNLDLGNNDLTQFDYNILKNITNLYSLDLSGNRLQKLPKIDLLNLSLSEDIYNNRFAIKLNLSSNHLESFNGSLVPPYMDAMDLSNNKIVSLVNLKSFEIYTISFKNNNIKKINTTFGKVNSIDLSGNQLEELPNSLFNRSTLLVTLYISNNIISKIGNDVFSGVYRLRKLHLDGNKIKTLPLGLFRDLRDLDELDLSSNQIENFQFGTFDSLVGLITLNLSNNKLKDLNPHVFHAVLHLRNLYFDNNLIISLDVEYITSTFPYLRSISLDHNPWHCKELVIIYQKFRKTMTRIIEGEVFDKANVHGIACFMGNSTFNDSSKHPFDDYYGYIREVINNDIDRSEMGSFIDKKIKDVDIILSSTKSTLLEENKDTALVTVSAIQIIMAFTLLIIVSLVFIFLKKVALRHRAAVASRLELIAAE